MKRKILFRGKRPNSGKWIQGFLFENKLSSWILSDKFNSPECSCEVIPETVSQFTGLIDKNGKMIFEGDILKSGQSDHLYIIEFNYGAFYCYHSKIKNWDGMRLKWGGIWRFTELGMDIEVIYNIHDNPKI